MGVPGNTERFVYGWLHRSEQEPCVSGKDGARCRHRQFSDAAVAAHGKRILLNGTKDGDVFALDPDEDGKPSWRVKATAGGGRGGVVWGGATDS